MGSASSFAPSALAFDTAGDTGARAIRLSGVAIIGALLLFAAITKILTGRPGEIGIAAAELALVGVMVAFRSRWQVWALVACVFGAFAGWTGFLVYWDAPTCGCFGDLGVNPSVTLWIDTAALLLAALAASVGAGPEGRFTGVLTAAAAAAGIGVAASFASSDPRPQDYGGDAVAQLLALPGMEDVASASPVAPAWYLYLYDPACPLCKRHLPQMLGLESSTQGSDRFRVRTVDIVALQRDHGVPAWAWGQTPVTLVIERGRVMERAEGRAFLDPVEVAALYDQGEQYNPVRELMSLPQVADIAGASGPRPAWLVYVYTEGCGPCADHLRAMEQFTQAMGDDPILRIRSFTRGGLERLGIPADTWGALRTAVLVEGGQVTRGWSADDIPDPVLLWGELAAGVMSAPQE